MPSYLSNRFDLLRGGNACATPCSCARRSMCTPTQGLGRPRTNSCLCTLCPLLALGRSLRGQLLFERLGLGGLALLVGHPLGERRGRAVGVALIQEHAGAVLRDAV